MPLDISDAPSLVPAVLPVLRTFVRALRRSSEGGRKLTKSELRDIGQKLVDIGTALLKEAAD